MKGLEALIIMRGDAQGAFKKGIEFPMYVLKEQVEIELGKLEKHGVMKKTKKSCWANPTVATKG